MTNGFDAVRQHYGMSGILDRVNGFLLERGIDPERPSYEDFFPASAVARVSSPRHPAAA